MPRITPDMPAVERPMESCAVLLLLVPVAALLGLDTLLPLAALGDALRGDR